MNSSMLHKMEMYHIKCPSKLLMFQPFLKEMFHPLLQMSALRVACILRSNFFFLTRDYISSLQAYILFMRNGIKCGLKSDNTLVTMIEAG